MAALFRWPDLLDVFDIPDGMWEHSQYATHPMSDPEDLIILKSHPTSQCTSTNPTNVSPIYDNNFWVCCNPYHWSRVLRDPHPVSKRELEGRFLFPYLNKYKSLLDNDQYLICHKSLIIYPGISFFIFLSIKMTRK